MSNYTYQEQDVPGAIPLYLNSSALKRAHCRRAFAMTWHGYAPPEPPESQEFLTVGKAIHRVAEEFARAADPVEAVRMASKAYPSVPRAQLITAAAGRQRILLPPPLTIGGKLAVEFKFRIPWYSFTYDGKTYQLIVCGTIDHLSYDRGAVRIYDFKTSRLRMRDYALAKYEHSSQFAFYQWALWRFAARMGLPLDVANEIRAGKISSQVVPVLLSVQDIPWVIGPVRSLSIEQFSEYERNLFTLVFETLVPFYFRGANAPADGMINDSCQYCLFKSYCYAKSEDEAADILSKYPTKQYDPTNNYE